MRYAVRVVCAALVVLWVASTAFAAPTTDGAKAREVFDGLVQQGTNALMANDYPAALAVLLDAKQVYDRKLKDATPGATPEQQVAMMHGLALAYQLVERPEKASPLFANGTPLDRACQAKGAPRQLLLTRAALDLTQGYLAMRTAVGLTAYLKEHPNELDSEILDVLFTALTKAEERVGNRQTLDAMIKNYDEFNTRLEATRPRERRWGVQWVNPVKFDIEMKKRQAAQRDYQKALDRLADAESELKQAKEALAKTRLLGAARAARDRVARAEDRRAAAQNEAADAKGKIPPVPVLEKADLVRIIEPHEVKVVVAAAPPGKRTGTAAPVQVASAEGEKAIEFSLGGGSSNGGKASSTDTGSSTPVEPVTPTQSRRRSFARGATGFAVGPDLLLTAASAVKGAGRVVVEFPNGQPMDAAVERTGSEGLALLRIRGQKMAYVNLAQQFAGGAVQCPAYPEVSVFGVSVEVLKGKALGVADEGWKVSLGKHPRLAGAPLLDSNGDLVGVEMADREDLTTQLPALSLKAVRAFLGSDLPGQPSGNPRAAAVVQVTGSFER